MRVLLSGILGAIVGESAWLAADHFLQANYGWLICLVGLATGLAIRLSGAPKSGSGISRGALAIALTLLAIVGGRMLYTKVIQDRLSLTNDQPVAAAVREIPVQEADTEDASTEAAETAVPAEVLDRRAPAALRQVGPMKPVSGNLPQWDTLWMSLAALAAYVISQKGSCCGTQSCQADPAEDAETAQE
jgi:hypothetical protein